MDYNIYKIHNTINSQLYVGCTTLSIEARLHEHVLRAINPRNTINSPDFALHQAIKTLGADKFSIALIESGKGDKHLMFSRESHWIRKLSTAAPVGYNLKVRVLTDEQIAVIRYDVLGLTAKAYAKMFGVSDSTILIAKNGRGSCYKSDPYAYINSSHLPTDIDSFVASFKKTTQPATN